MNVRNYFPKPEVNCLLTLWILNKLTTLPCARFQRTSTPLHRRMDPFMLKNTFYVETYDEVPEYEIVQVWFLNKRNVQEKDVEQVYFSAFEQNIHLKLQPNEDFDAGLRNLRLHLAVNTRNGVQYRQMPPQENDDLGTSYLDLTQMAAVNIRLGIDGKLQMDGMIGDDLVIKHLPTEFLVPEDGLMHDSFNSQFRQKENSTATTSKGTHVIYKRQESPPSYFLSLNDGLTNGYFNLSWTAHSRTRRADESTTVWPEILLIVDYETYLLHGRKKSSIKRYFASFWNAVDLRYRPLSNPKVRLCLTNIIIADTKAVVPYIERHRLEIPNHDTINAARALSSLGSFMYSVREKLDYDIVVAMTKLNLCTEQDEFGNCKKNIAGRAYVGGACGIFKGLVISVALVKDRGGFGGINTATHEVGHLLGCVHDGSPANEYGGGPGALQCPMDDGYIMSHNRAERGHVWSPCSVEQLRYFLNNESASCLYNFPFHNLLEPKELPGKILTLDEQCTRDWGTKACFEDSRVCTFLYCRVLNNPNHCIYSRPAADGSFCGHGKVCKDGKCIHKDVSIKSSAENEIHFKSKNREHLHRLITKLLLTATSQDE